MLICIVLNGWYFIKLIYDRELPKQSMDFPEHYKYRLPIATKIYPSAGMWSIDRVNAGLL
jgi:hypothetical protein